MAQLRTPLMDAFVLDASVTMAWILDDEDSPEADAALGRVQQGGAVVPYFWHIEIRNGLLLAERRNRISAALVRLRLGGLEALSIETDDALDFNAAYGLAQTHGLTFYDAVYLELALRRNAPLATLDNALSRAAVAAGLTLLR